MTKPKKAKKLIDYLEECLLSGKYPTGSKIPSVRRFADKFEISFGTALGGIDYLCKQGKLKKVPHRGIFVCERPDGQEYDQVKRIAVFMEPYVTEVHCGPCYTAFLGMQEAALKAGYTFMVNPILINDITPDIIKQMSKGAKGVIFLNEYDLHLKKLDLNIPVVGVLMDNSFEGTISTVNLDPWSAASYAADYFEAHKIKKVTIASSYKPIFITRDRAFATTWRERGYECNWLSRQGYPEIDFDKKQGYLFTSDHRLQKYSEKFQHKTGYTLAEKHIVIGMDGKQLIDPDFHRFPTIAVDWKTIGEVAFNECLSRINNPNTSPKNITLTGRALF